MSMLTRARSIGRHRGKTPAQLKAALDKADCTLIGLATEIDGLKAERTDLERHLDAASVDLSGVLEDLETARKQIRRLEVEVAELRAFKANHDAVDVPPMERDTRDGADQATGPINVRPLWEAHSTDPGHARQTSRDVDDTQPLSTVEEVA